MPIVVLGKKKAVDSLSFPRRGFRRLDPDDAGQDAVRWRRRVGRALSGARLLLFVDGGAEMLDRDTKKTIATLSLWKVAFFGDVSSMTLPPSGVDLLIADGVAELDSPPAIDVDLTQRRNLVALLDTLLPTDARPWRVYLLRCGDGSYYTGVSNDPVERLRKHQAGKGARYTRGRGPFRLLALSPPLTQGAALSFEAAIKKRLPREEKPLAVLDGP